MSDPRPPLASSALATRRSSAAQPATPPPHAHGLLVFEEARLVAVLDLPRGVLRIGRAADCGLRLRDAEVSRHHCEVTSADGSVQLRDLGSANGCLLDGRRVNEATLRHGDSLLVGQSLLRVLDRGSEEWRLHRRLFEQLYGDPASGLLNTRGLRLRAADWLERTPVGAGVSLALVAFETAGQGSPELAVAVDGVAAAVAAILIEHATGEPLAARIAPAEFAVLWREPQPARLPTRGESLRRALAALGKPALRPCIGLAWQARATGSVEALLRTADDALHRSRALGGAVCEVGFVEPTA